MDFFLSPFFVVIFFLSLCLFYTCHMTWSCDFVNVECYHSVILWLIFLCKMEPVFDMMWNDVCPCSDFPSHTLFIMCLKLCLFIVCLVIFGVCQCYWNVGSVKLVVVFSQVLIYLKCLTASCSFVISSQLIWVKLCTVVRIMHNMLFEVFIQEYKLMCFQTLHKLWSLFFLGTF